MPGVLNGETIGLGSNRLGWLHTFLSCINIFMTLIKCPLAKVSLVLQNKFQYIVEQTIIKDNRPYLTILLHASTYFVCDIKSSYRYLCLFERWHMTTCSYFFGICFSTSCFNRLNRNGLNTCLQIFFNDQSNTISSIHGRHSFSFHHIKTKSLIHCC